MATRAARPAGKTRKPPAKKPAAKKPAAKKAAAKKPTTKKPATKMPAAKRPPAKKPAAKKPPAKQATKGKEKTRVTGAPNRFGILWNLDVRFDDDGWFERPGAPRQLVDALAATSLWRHLDVVGLDYQPGDPIGSPADVAQLIDDAGNDTYTFAKGDPAHAVSTVGADVWMRVDLKPGWLGLSAGIRGAPFTAVGRAALDDLVTLIERLRRQWRGTCHLEHAAVRPDADPDFEYPGRDPRRTANRALHAILDVIEPGRAPGDDEWRVDDDRAMAEAKAPPGVRSERDGLVVFRWVDDPTDAGAASDAARRHDEWLSGVLDVQVDED